MRGYQRVFTGFKKIAEGRYVIDGVVHVYRGNARYLDADFLTDDNGHVFVYNPKKYLKNPEQRVSELVQNLRAYTVKFSDHKFTGFVCEDLDIYSIFKMNYIHSDLLDEHAYVTLEVEILENGEFRLALKKFDWLKEGYLQSDLHFNEFFRRIRVNIREEVLRLESLLRILIENGKAEDYVNTEEIYEEDSYDYAEDDSENSEIEDYYTEDDDEISSINNRPSRLPTKRFYDRDRASGRVSNLEDLINNSLIDEDYD